MADIEKKINNGLNIRTIAKIIAGEAGGEGKEGMIAVLSVAKNRLKQNPKRWGKTLYEVFTQPDQFSAYKDKDLMERNFKQVAPIVLDLVRNADKIKDNTGGATHYVTVKFYNKIMKSSKPHWIKKMVVTKQIGNHIFMKEK